MLFNLSCCRHFPNKQTGKEICCGSNYGPYFRGGNGCELSAFDEPFNGDGNCFSFANKSGYGIPVDAEGNNMLTKNKDDNFTISELEVWEITGYMKVKETL